MREQEVEEEERRRGAGEEGCGTRLFELKRRVSSGRGQLAGCRC